MSVPTNSASAYTKRSHTRHKPLDFIQSCKMPTSTASVLSSQAITHSDGLKKRRRKRRKNVINLMNISIGENCKEVVSGCKEEKQIIDNVSMDKESKPVDCESMKKSRESCPNNAGTFDFKEVCEEINEIVLDDKHLENVSTEAVILDPESVANIKYGIAGTHVSEQRTANQFKIKSLTTSPRTNEKISIENKVDYEKSDLIFGNRNANGSKRNVIDISPTFGNDNVTFENIGKNRFSNKPKNLQDNNNANVSCFSNRNETVLKGYGERLFESKRFAMSTDTKEDVVVANNEALTSQCDVQGKKVPQFWSGPKNRFKRNKPGNVFNNKCPSSKKNSEKCNSEVSWLDFTDQDNGNDDVKSESCFVNEKVSDSNVNDQLSSYKSRFSSTMYRAGNEHRLPDDVLLNNKNFEHKNRDSSSYVKRIGINVNNLKSSTKKYDSTKRSRRKAEPFDFEKQSDCSVEDLLENCKTKSFYNSNDGQKHSFDIPNSLCSFLTDALDSKPMENNSRALFSGSISDKGLYIPSTESMDNGLLSLKRNSFQRIFEKDYVFEKSDSGSDTDSSSEDDDMLDSGGYDTDERGEGVLLPPEPQLGNVEYKLKLVNPTKQRFEHLVTQMKWRLREGRGEAVYGIGVRDCGRVRGLRSGRMKASLRTLRHMSDRLGAQCSLLAVVKTGGGGRYGAEVLVRKVPDDQHNIELRVAVMGANDAGKSTLVGVLTQGELDNGRGSARLNMFRHLHEVRSGRTSSVSHEILGFDSQGRPINYAYGDLTTPEEIVERSSKLVSFIDLAGHRKYLKTTVQGLTGYSPHLAMLVISATGGVNQMTLEHLALTVALQLPLLIVSTRADCGPVPEEAISEMLTRANSRKVPHLIRTIEHCNVAAVSVWGLQTVPVFSVSSVNGQGLDLLRWFLYRLPPPPQCNKISRDLDQEAVEFQIDEVFRVGDRGGPVVAGLLKTGVITEKTKLLIGPLDSGDFAPAVVESIKRNRAACRAVRAGQAASLRLNCTVPHLRQGMVLLSIPDKYPHSLDIQEYENKYTPLVKNNNAQVCKERILSESSHLWNSEKVSPKATKKMRRRKKQTNYRTNLKDADNNNLNRIKEDSSTDTYDELEHNCDDGNVSSSERKGENDDNQNAKDNKRVIDYELSTVDYDKSAVDRIKDKNLCNCNVEKDVAIENILKDPDHASRLSILDLKLDKENLVKCFSVEECQHDNIAQELENDLNEPRGCYFFEAQIKLLHNSSDIYPGFQSTVHIGSIRQTAVIEAILSRDSNVAYVRAGCLEYVLFRFLRHPEYLRISSPLLFREGLHTKGVGHVTHIYHHHNNNNGNTAD